MGVGSIPGPPGSPCLPLGHWLTVRARPWIADGKRSDEHPQDWTYDERKK